MGKPLHLSDRCRLFEQIADSVWAKIIRAHTVGIDPREEGITADIIIDILHYNMAHTPNFDVYATPGWNEQTYGSDMDVFVETAPNQYRWFALQAKILKQNDRYTTLRDSSDEVMQWDKLNLLEALSGCKAYYLLYNGKDDYTYTGRDECGRSFRESQFGCSLVEPSVIKKLANRRNTRGTRYINPRFTDVHPDEAEPWRVLVCCYQDTNDFTLYSAEQIVASNPNFKPIEQLGNIEGEEADLSSELPRAPNNEIAIASLEAGWKPRLRMVVKRTDNFIQ
jgi:hypothetical protein